MNKALRIYGPQDRNWGEESNFFKAFPEINKRDISVSNTPWGKWKKRCMKEFLWGVKK